MDEKVCPKCKSDNVKFVFVLYHALILGNQNTPDKTCNSFKKDEEPEWSGRYCFNCGHWWEGRDG